MSQPVKRTRAWRAGRAALIVTLAALLLGSGAPARAAPAAQGGSTSGTWGWPNDLYLEWTLGGAEIKLKEGYQNSYLGTWGGGPITLSGTLTMVRAKGSTSWVSLEASAGDQKLLWPAEGGMIEVEGRSESKSFNLSYQVPAGYAAMSIPARIRVDYCGQECSFYVVTFDVVLPAPAAEPVAPQPGTGPQAPPKAPAGAGPLFPPGYTPPCDIPLYFYPDQDFREFYTGAPSLRYSQDELVNDLLRGLQRYAAMGAPVTEGTKAWDVADIAQTFTQDLALPEGEAVAPALQRAARELARQKQVSDPAYRVSPGELLELSLKLNGGNVRNALLTCHAALFRDAKGANKKFVEKEGVLAPLRNAEAYADGTWSYNTPHGKTRTANPRAIGEDEQGPWYHLYGVTALEFTDGYGAASYHGAQAWMWAVGDKSKKGALDKIKQKGYPVSGLGGVLGDWSLALEEGIRSQAGKPPDIDKNCINYWALKAGRELRRLVKDPKLVSPPPEEWTPRGQWREGTDRVSPIGHGRNAAFKSPLSLRIEGTGGEWFSFDQVTRQFDGNTPLVVFDFFPEEDGTVGLAAQPLFEVESMLLTATGTGPAQVATYDPATRKAEAYELSVQPGDQIVLPGREGPALLNGSPLEPAATTAAGRGLPGVPIAAGAGGALLLAAGGVLLARRRRRRAARAVAQPPREPARLPAAVVRPAAAAPAGGAACQGCGAPLKPGIKFCGSCGAAVPQAPAACPGCGQPATPGARFCGTCGQALSQDKGR